jgi:hypothetical protein
MGQDDLGFRVANMLDGSQSSCGSLKGRVVSETDILRCMDENATSDEARILTGMDQPGQPE